MLRYIRSKNRVFSCSRNIRLTFSKSFGVQKDENHETRGNKYIESFRETYKKYPSFILPSLVGIQTSIFATSFSLFLVFPSFFNISLNFTVAYGLCAALRQLTLPLDIVTASVVLKVLPVLKEVKLLELFPLNKFLSARNKEKPSKLTDMINKYGFGYLVASRTNNALITLGLWYCLENGYDAKKILVDSLHLDVQTVDKVVPWFSFYSVTVTATDVFLLATLYYGFYFARKVGKFVAYYNIKL